MSFLSKVLLRTSMFCSICDFGMSRKWQTQEKSMFASNSVETFGTLKVNLDGRQWEEHSFWVVI